MAPNLLLLAFAPDITGIAAETAAKSSRLHRLYDFIIETQSPSAQREAARDTRDVEDDKPRAQRHRSTTAARR